MASPTHVATYSSGYSVRSCATNTLTIAGVSADDGDVLVLKASLENASSDARLTTPTGGSGLAWILRQSPNDNAGVGVTPAYVWTATATEALSGVTLTVPWLATSGSSFWCGATCRRWSGSDGIGASAANTGSSGAPTVTVTTTAADSAVDYISVDWNAADGASRAYVQIDGATPVDTTYARDASYGTAYGAYYANAGAAGSKTAGLSAPTGQLWAAVAVEVLGNAEPPPPAPGSGTHRARRRWSRRAFPVSRRAAIPGNVSTRSGSQPATQPLSRPPRWAVFASRVVTAASDPAGLSPADADHAITHTLAGSATVATAAAATHPLTHDLTAAATRDVPAAGTHALTAAFTAAAEVGSGAAASHDLVAGLAAAAVRGAVAAATHPLTHGLTAAATRGVPAAGSLPLTHDLTAAAIRGVPAAGTHALTAAFTAAATVGGSSTADAVHTLTHGLTAAATRGVPAAGTHALTAAFTAAAEAGSGAAAAHTLTHALTAAATRGVRPDAVHTLAAGWAAAAVVQSTAAGSLPLTHALTAAATRGVPAAGTHALTAAFTAAAVVASGATRVGHLTASAAVAAALTAAAAGTAAHLTTRAAGAPTLTGA